MDELKALTRADVDAAKRPERWLPVPELGGKVLLRSLSLNKFLDVMSTAGEGNGEFGKHLVAEMLIDPVTDEPMFSAAEIHKIGEQHDAAMLRIINAAKTMLGLTADAPKASDSALSEADSTAIASS